MSTFNEAWVVANSPSSIAELAAGAKLFSDNVSVVFAGDEDDLVAPGKAYYLGAIEGSYLCMVPTVVNLAKEHKPELVLVESTNDGRLACAALAAALGTSAIVDVASLETNGDTSLTAQRMVYGGAAYKTLKVDTASKVVCVPTATFEPIELGKPSEVETVAPVAVEGIAYTGKKVKEAQTVNLPAAKRVIGVGRGIGSEENLGMVKELAKLMEAEVGCSRPIAEEEKWMPKETYIGVSGLMLKPDLYFAIGISGQVQHMVGVSGARNIVAIDKDKNSPIFSQCDLGIVGDLNKIVPALIAKFQ